MIRINLLPVRQIKQRIRTKNGVIAFACFFCVLLVALGFVGYTQVSKIEDLKKTKAQLVKEKKKHESVLKRIEKIKKEKALLATKLEVIKNIVWNETPQLLAIAVTESVQHAVVGTDKDDRTVVGVATVGR